MNITVIIAYAEHTDVSKFCAYKPQNSKSLQKKLWFLRIE
jgi:hypothetical protein